MNEDKLISYKVFKSPDGDYCAVKQGFSWPAFIFTFLWALYNRLWLATLIILALFLFVDLMLYLSEFIMHSTALNSYKFYVALAVGLLGNKAIEKSLISNDYKLVGTSALATKSEAIESFIKQI